MYAHVEKSKENKNRLVANSVAQKKSNGRQGFEFMDNRPESVAQRKLQAMANNYSTSQPIQQKENKTGLPDNLKTGIENLSGYSMNDVKVHYNSDKPAQLQAHACTAQSQALPNNNSSVAVQKEEIEEKDAIPQKGECDAKGFSAGNTPPPSGGNPIQKGSGRGSGQDNQLI